jgi:hypothetical protein
VKASQHPQPTAKMAKCVNGGYGTPMILLLLTHRHPITTLIRSDSDDYCVQCSVARGDLYENNIEVHLSCHANVKDNGDFRPE